MVVGPRVRISLVGPAPWPEGMSVILFQGGEEEEEGIVVCDVD